MRLWLLMVLTAMVGLATAAETYRWVDENGQVHFSDRPQPGAERIQLESAQTFTPPPLPASPDTAAEPESDAAPSTRYQLSITKPASEETLWNVAGQVEVSLSLSPRLERGHAIGVFLDGERLSGLPTRNTSFSLSDIVRGTHTMQAVVEDSGGQVLMRSESVVFHVRQTSVQTPRAR